MPVRRGALAYLSLFASLGTLLCCALPATLVLLGLGATVASVIASQPWLAALSRHKDYVFAGTALLLAASWFYATGIAPAVLARLEGCPPDGGAPCAPLARLTRAALWFATALYAVGFGVAYLVGPALAALAR